MGGCAEDVVLSLGDLGCRIVAEFTPVRFDGVEGEKATAVSEIVVEGEPVALDLSLPERMEEDIPVPMTRRYGGGKEGRSKWAWFRASEKPQTPTDTTKLRQVAYTE